MQGLARTAALAATLALLGTSAAQADVIDPGAEPLGRSLQTVDGQVTGARFTAEPPTKGQTALGTNALAGFPTSGADYALLTTGDAAIAGEPDTAENSGKDLGGTPVRGNTDFDVTVIEIDLNVPANTNCMIGMDFRFLSEEFSEYVNSQYNDAFIAEIDNSTWTTSGSTISAPGNFAFDPDGNPISINAAGVTSMKEEFSAGTTYDGATPILSAATPISPGPHKLYLSIFDQGDPVYDSAVMVDNIRFARVSDVTRDCRPGAELADASKHVMLGDSYSSGFGNGSYDEGTHEEDGNDCQRSSHAFGPLVAVALELEPSNHACQGAVTKDFYFARNSTWGEVPQLDHLDPETGLVTFSIGGNDADFSTIVKECALGFELLPFNTCFSEDKVTEPVKEAFERLDNKRATPADTTPYDTLYKDVRRRAPFATYVAMGYPPFFTPEGSDRTSLPGGRCELIKKADQKWMVSKIADFNELIKRNAERNGFRFADPTSRFLGHELCGEGEEWFYDALNAGKFHPTVAGQHAMSETVLEELLADDDRPRFEVHPGETAEFQFVIDRLLEWLSTIISWPGSDVELTLISPSGKEYTRAAPGTGVKHDNGPTWEQFEIPNPEQGTWTVKMYGADVNPAGEEVRLSVVQQEPANKPPVAKIKWAKVGDQITLDATGSTDADGTIKSYSWYLNTSEGEQTKTGTTFTFPRPTKPQSVMLAVTDDDGATAFDSVSTLPMDVLPGLRLNPIIPSLRVPLPVSILSTADFDATKLDTSTLRLGRGEEKVMKIGGVTKVDLNRDKRKDLLLLFWQPDVQIKRGDKSLCMTGTLPDEQQFTSCDEIRTL